MKCWKCGSDNKDVSFCLYCGVSQKRKEPVSNYGKALRKIFDDFGHEKVFEDSRCITSALGDLIPDSDAFVHSIEYVYHAGFGKLYEAQIRDSGKPDENFYKQVRKKITGEAGLTDTKADQIINCFDEMIGWETSLEAKTEIPHTSQMNKPVISNSGSAPVSAPMVSPTTQHNPTVSIQMPTSDMRTGNSLNRPVVQSKPVTPVAHNEESRKKAKGCLVKGILAITFAATFYLSFIGIIIGGIGIGESKSFRKRFGYYPVKVRVGKYLSICGLSFGIIETVIWVILIISAILANVAKAKAAGAN